MVFKRGVIIFQENIHPCVLYLQNYKFFHFSVKEYFIFLFYFTFLSATLIGVVRQDVNRSAGRSGDIGRSWSAEQAAS